MPHSPTPLDILLAVLKLPERTGQIATQPDLWGEIKSLAEIHRLSGVLASTASASLPPAERPWRDRVLMVHHRRHQLFLGQLRVLVEAFRAEGIPCVVLKGPLLAERIHPVPFLKFSHDLDLLVRASDIPPAARLMERAGFALRGNYPWSVHRGYSHDLEFAGAGDVGTVEVHFALKAGPRIIAAEDFIDRAVPWRSADGSEFQVLSPADEGFYLIVHAAGHAFHRLRWLYDALAVLKTLSGPDLARVRSMALKMRVTGYFVAADLASLEFFGEGLPLDLTGFAKPWLWSRLRTDHLRTMAHRENYNALARTLDVCRMSGTPASALQLCLRNGAGKLPALLYRLRGGATGPEVLARTIPD